MGIIAILEHEDRREIAVVGDPQNRLRRLLPSPDDGSFDYIRFIDPYGHTTFNHLQAPKFLSEWQRLYSKCAEPEEESLLRQIEDLAKRLVGECHMYLRFEGD